MTGSSGQPEDSHASLEIAQIHRVLVPLCLCMVGAIAVFYELGEYRTLGSHEAYVAVPAREMLATGDYVIPMYAGLPRLEKPPLSYWIAAASVRFFGEMNEWTLRFPFALSGVVLATLLWFWGRRWYGPVAGWGAAIAQLTAVYSLIYTRKAEIDTLLCLLTTTSLFLIADQKADERRGPAFLRWSVIYALLGLSWLAKFHYGMSMVLAPAIVYFLVRSEFRRILQLLNPVGLVLLAGAIFVWPSLLLKQVPDALTLWKAETLGRATGGLGYQPVWYFVVPILWMLLPWTPYALAAAIPSWRRAWSAAAVCGESLKSRICRGDAREQFLWIWFLADLAIVSISADKHRHYIMAGLPMFSLLVGQQMARLSEWVRGGRRLLDWVWVWPTTVMSILGAATIAVLSGRFPPNLVGPVLWISGTLCLGVIVIVWLLYFRRTIAAVYVVMLVFVACYVTTNSWILRTGDHRVPFGAFAAQIRQADVAGDAEILAYRVGYHSLLYYMEHPLMRSESFADIRRRLAAGKPIYVLTVEPRLEELETIGHYRRLKTLDLSRIQEVLTRWPIHLIELHPPQVVPEYPSPTLPVPRQVAKVPGLGSETD